MLKFSIKLKIHNCYHNSRCWSIFLCFRRSEGTRKDKVKVRLRVEGTLDCEDCAAADAASIVTGLTGVDAAVLEARGAQLEVRRRVNKHQLIVVSVSYLLVISVPAHIQGGGAGGLAFKTVSLTQLHKHRGRKFLDKLRRFCKVKGEMSSL